MVNKDPIWLFSHPSQYELASHIEEASGKISNKRHIVFKKVIHWNEFEDGFPNLFIENVKEMIGKDVIFLASFHQPSVLFEQLSMLNCIPRYSAKSLTVLLPYFPCATMERVDEEGQVATAKSLASLLSGISMTRSGPPKLVVYDIHALQERFYFSDSILPRLESALPLLVKRLSSLQKQDFAKANPLVIAFPDDGACKRYGKLMEGAALTDRETIVCTKVRDGRKRLVRIREGNPRGCHVIIVDDLVMTGGTLIECAKVLLEAGAVKVSAYVTHAVFPRDSWHAFCPDLAKDSAGAVFTYFWITDSLPQASIIAKHAPFEILSLAELIADLQI